MSADRPIYGLCWSRRRMTTLAPLLQAAVKYPPLLRRDIDVLLAWGRKRGTRRALRWPGAQAVPVVFAEEGFLRSVGLGDADPPLSIVLDSLGVYYDATVPSQLELMVGARHDDAQRSRALRLAELWREARVSKYNHAREMPPPVAGPYVLAVDQTLGDASISFGLADRNSFPRMLEAALDEHPNLPVLLKVHPDVVAGRKQGNFGALTPGQRARVRIVAVDAHPPSLIEPAAVVYTVTSQMGFEALLWDKPVRVFGMPFYAGWGLTSDDLAAPARRRPVALPDLIHAALIDYPRYLDPETLQRCEVERLIEWMGLQRRMRERFAPRVHAPGLRGWKQPVARDFFQGSELVFTPPPPAQRAAATMAVWGRPPGPPPRGDTLRLEDGFLRSVGLGADLVRPVSWVMDRSGMYYDAGAPSDLESLLSSTPFDAGLRCRAAALRERIVRAGLTKYNVGAGGWQRPAGSKRVVLVPGQVEADASIAYGSPLMRSNDALLRAARASAPEAHIIYKPHPDVLAGLRSGGDSALAATQAQWDEVVTDVPMHALLDQVDEVHTLTSLAGFEALLRGKAVTCHGGPFYAGWGLTTDRVELPRRGRRLTLDELVAGVLILYPTYVSRSTGRFTTPERAVEELATWRHQGAPTANPLGRWFRPLRSRWLAWRHR